jgi:hypothetical protein
MHFDESNEKVVSDLRGESAQERVSNRFAELAQMTREELLAIPFEEIDMLSMVKAFRAPEEVENRFHDHVEEVFAHDIAPHVKALNEAYASAPGVGRPDLAQALGKEHGLVAVNVWKQLTADGINDLERAKWMHKQLCWTILSFFQHLDAPGVLTVK